MTDPDAMLATARAARPNAYVPYSGFPVAAVVEGESGRLFVGVNVDNASYPETACAEANAIGAMIAAGDRRVAAVLVLGGLPGSGVLCTPCGGCRQRLAEFMPPGAPVHMCDDTGIRETLAFGDLLPRAFGPLNLGK